MEKCDAHHDGSDVDVVQSHGFIFCYLPRLILSEIPESEQPDINLYPYGKGLDQYVYMMEGHWVSDIGGKNETVFENENMHVTFERLGHAIADTSCTFACAGRERLHKTE